jgi:Leucine-rich repeat (LRR) protein
MHILDLISGEWPETNSTIYEWTIEYQGITDIVGFDTCNIKWLALPENKIENLEGFDPQGLQELLIDYNQIKTIEKFDVKILQTLNVAENQIKTIEKFDVKILQNLDISGNPIELLHNFNPKKLKWLTVSNDIKYINPKILKNIIRISGFKSKNFDSEGFIKGLSEKEKTRIREKIKNYK